MYCFTVKQKTFEIGELILYILKRNQDIAMIYFFLLDLQK